jgi:hypothetical protein
VAGRADSILLEPIGQEGEGVEFRLTRGATPEYWQIKRQQSSKGVWSVRDLRREGVLDAFAKKLRSYPGSTCCFASTLEAYPLRELTERTRTSRSWDEFHRDLLTSEPLIRCFEELPIVWGCSPRQAYELLQRIFCRVSDEGSLTTSIEAQAERYVSGEGATACAVLTQIALDNVNHELPRSTLIEELQRRGLSLDTWSKDSKSRQTIADTNSLFLGPIKDATIRDHQIHRPETDEIVSLLTTTPDRCVILAGDAGAGKSGVVLQVCEELEQLSWPVLVLRLDRLQTALTPLQLGNQLDLPGSPANVLAGISDGRPCFLVIDQLDAVSVTSGRTTKFFDCIRLLIEQALSHENLRVLVACRQFDLDNDPRLRRLQEQKSLEARVIKLGNFPAATVLQIVRDIGMDPSTLTPQQLDLLSLPLHLSLLSEMTSSSAVSPPVFNTATDLFDMFWTRKQDALQERLGRQAKWIETIDALCDYMSTNQALTAPVVVLDALAEDARAMVSERVLSLDRHSYSFFHQSFFDYAFARGFGARRGDLLSFLLNDEQHLFRRAQVREILRFQRDGMRAEYISNLKRLLAHQDVRFHLKTATFDLLSQITDPTYDEWIAVAPCLGTPSLGAQALRLLAGSLAWFKLVDSRGVVGAWLDDADDGRVDFAVRLLLSVERRGDPTVVDRIAELLHPYVGRSESWNRRLRFVFGFGDPGASRSFFDLFLTLLDNGLLDDMRWPGAMNSDFWSYLYSLARQKPDWTAEAVGHYVSRRLALASGVGVANPFEGSPPFIPDSQFAGDVIEKAATNAPAKFVSAV